MENKSKNKSYVLRFREVNRDIFNSIKKGKKKIETRAATVKYRNIKVGDSVILVCGGDRFTKIVVSTRIFSGVPSMLKMYSAKEINPNVKTSEELLKIYFSFPGYREKLKKFGLITIELR